MDIDPFWFWASVLVVAWLLSVLVPAFKIVGNAGYSPWWCILAVIPIVNIIAYWVFAFARWPVLKDAIDLKRYGKPHHSYLNYWSARITVDSRDAEAYLRRGERYCLLGSGGVEKNRNRKIRFLDKAIADLTEVIKLNPECSDAHYQRGKAYAEKGNRDLSAIDYNEVISLLTLDIGRMPDNATLLQKRANAYQTIGNYDRALADFNRALELEPDNYEIYYGRASVYFWQDDCDRALADVNQAIKLSPEEKLPPGWSSWTRSYLYVLRGRIYRRMAYAHISEGAFWRRPIRQYKNRSDTDFRIARGEITTGAAAP